MAVGLCEPDGVIDEGKTEHKFSIKNDEAAFGMDLDGDEKEGFDVTILRQLLRMRLVIFLKRMDTLITFLMTMTRQPSLTIKLSL